MHPKNNDLNILMNLKNNLDFIDLDFKSLLIRLDDTRMLLTVTIITSI